jgi:hypothetical protein
MIVAPVLIANAGHCSYPPTCSNPVACAKQSMAGRLLADPTLLALPTHCCLTSWLACIITPTPSSLSSLTPSPSHSSSHRPPRPPWTLSSWRRPGGWRPGTSSCWRRRWVTGEGETRPGVRGGVWGGWRGGTLGRDGARGGRVRDQQLLVAQLGIRAGGAVWGCKRGWGGCRWGSQADLTGGACRRVVMEGGGLPLGRVEGRSQCWLHSSTQPPPA